MPRPSFHARHSTDRELQINLILSVVLLLISLCETSSFDSALHVWTFLCTSKCKLQRLHVSVKGPATTRPASMSSSTSAVHSQSESSCSYLNSASGWCSCSGFNLHPVPVLANSCPSAHTKVTARASSMALPPASSSSLLLIFKSVSVEFACRETTARLNGGIIFQPPTLTASAKSSIPEESASPKIPNLPFHPPKLLLDRFSVVKTLKTSQQFKTN